MANKEIGRIGQRRYGGTIYEEFLHELRGTRGIEVYREMSENDDVVGAILFAIEMLVRQCDWNVEPGGDTAKDKEAAEFVESCMHDMQDTWTDTISEILSFLTYGWSFHEIVYKRRITYQELRKAVADGSLSKETLEAWQQDYSVLVAERLQSMWTQAIAAGPTGQPILDGLAFEFNTQTQRKRRCNAA